MLPSSFNPNLSGIPTNTSNIGAQVGPGTNPIPSQAPTKITGMQAQQLSALDFKGSGTLGAFATPAVKQSPTIPNHIVYMPIIMADASYETIPPAQQLSQTASLALSTSQIQTASTTQESFSSELKIPNPSPFSSHTETSFTAPESSTLEKKHLPAMDRTRLATNPRGSVKNPLPLDHTNLPSQLRIVGNHKHNGKTYLKYRSNEGKFYISRESSVASSVIPKPHIAKQPSNTGPTTSSESITKPAITRNPSKPQKIPKELSKKTKSGLLKAIRHNILFQTFTAVCGALFLPIIFTSTLIYKAINKRLLQSTKSNTISSLQQKTPERVSPSKQEPSSIASTSSADTSISYSKISETSRATTASRPPERLGTKENPVILDNIKALPPSNMVKNTGRLINIHGKEYVVLKGTLSFKGNFYAIEKSNIHKVPLHPGDPLAPQRKPREGSLENPILGKLPPKGLHMSGSISDIGSQRHYICEGLGPYAGHYYAVSLDKIDSVVEASPPSEIEGQEYEEDEFEQLFAESSTSSPESPSENFSSSSSVYESARSESTKFHTVTEKSSISGKPLKDFPSSKIESTSKQQHPKG